MNKVTKAVILAAGRGTRFLPYTKAVSKELIAVVDKPAISLVVDEVVQSGITDICLVISPEKEGIKQYYASDLALEEFLQAKGKQKELQAVKELSKTANFTYVIQPFASGSGAAVALTREFCNGQPAVILNADDAVYNEGIPATKQLIDCYSAVCGTILGVQTVTRENIGKYASCKVVKTLDQRTHFINDVIEKPTPEQVCSLLAPLGRYVISGDFFEYLDQTTVAKNGELQFTDALALQARKCGIYAYDFAGRRYDLGDKSGYLEAVVEYALRDANLGEKFAKYLKTIK